MDRTRTRTHEPPSAPARRFKETLDSEPDRGDATIAAPDRLLVADDDRGGDPYNRTGRFERVVR